jgi:predicted signal transduction protein with EAL and GGDEF domain
MDHAGNDRRSVDFDGDWDCAEGKRGRRFVACYSSLSYLRAFPFSKIKIDQSFVAGLGGKSDNVAIIGAINDLGRSLGVPTIAEGVETRAQLRLVRDAGCKQAQGFLFSRPIPHPKLRTSSRAASASQCTRRSEATCVGRPTRSPHSATL